MSLGDRSHNLLEGIVYDVEAGTVVVNPLYYQEDDIGGLSCRETRAVDGQAECLEDKTLTDVFRLERWSDYWGVGLPCYFIMTTYIV